MKKTVLAVIFLFISISLKVQAEAYFPFPPAKHKPAETVQRIAFGSCAMQQLDQPIWDTILSRKPDLYLSLGDAIYGDWDGKQVVPATPESLKRDWKILAKQPGFIRLRQKVPTMATWDNHDYGTHNGGTEFPLKEQSKQIFLDFWGEPEDSERRKRSGIYTAKIFGPAGKRAQVILLDTRSFKEPVRKDTRGKAEKKALNIAGKYLPTKDPQVTLLGQAQWSWLEQQLKQPAEIRLIGSSTQIIADEKLHDEWGNYPLERQRLFSLIEKTHAEGVILLSGNMHFAEISKLKQFTYPLIDFTSSGLTHTNKNYAQMSNSQRIAGPYTEVNFGLVEFNWNAEPGPAINLQAIGLDGKTVFSHSLVLDAKFGH